MTEPNNLTPVEINVQKYNPKWTCSGCGHKIWSVAGLIKCPKCMHPVAKINWPTIKLMSYSVKSGKPDLGELQKNYNVTKSIDNPWRVKSLRPLTGLDPAVQSWLMRCPKTILWLESLVATARNCYNISIGCTGGKHRSVALIEMVAARLAELGIPFEKTHRDLKVKHE